MKMKLNDHEFLIVEPVREAILKRTALLIRLGAGHLALNRNLLRLVAGKPNVFRLANQAATGLRNVLYIL